MIYAPDTSIGSTYSGSFTVNYRDDYGESRTDTFPLGLVVVGKVELVLYGESIRPQPARNGSKVEITATLLNKGTVSAMYVNASIVPNSILRLTPGSTTYIGEIEENSQSPFTLDVYIKDDVNNGTYPITMKINYRDDQYVDRSFNSTFYLTVMAVKAEHAVSQGTSGFSVSLSEQAFTLATVIAASVAILFLYRRHLARQKRSIQPGEIQQ